MPKKRLKKLLRRRRRKKPPNRLPSKQLKRLANCLLEVLKLSCNQESVKQHLLVVLLEVLLKLLMFNNSPPKMSSQKYSPRKELLLQHL